jgi:hypothetical protein
MLDAVPGVDARMPTRLLELFQDPKTNPRNAQLIFTTHDTSLLNCLNRDEVWLTEKPEAVVTNETNDDNAVTHRANEPK